MAQTDILFPFTFSPGCRPCETKTERYFSTASYEQVPSEAPPPPPLPARDFSPPHASTSPSREERTDRRTRAGESAVRTIRCPAGGGGGRIRRRRTKRPGAHPSQDADADAATPCASVADDVPPPTASAVVDEDMDDFVEDPRSPPLSAERGPTYNLRPRRSPPPPPPQTSSPLSVSIAPTECPTGYATTS